MAVLNLLSFKDLKSKNIVTNRPQLSRLIKSGGFPPGFMISENSRRWREEDIVSWLNDREAESIRQGKG